MANPYFQFKQFTVWHDKCAMKVGTDGVLLGAWTSVENTRSILDVGCGTGLISLMLAQRCQAIIDALDIDPAACMQARENADRSPFGQRLQVIHRPFADFVTEFAGIRQYDCIVSNPPYIPTADIASLEPEVREHDPLSALDGGADGFAHYEKIASLAPLLLKKGGYILLEAGIGQARHISEVFAGRGLSALEIRPDLAGTERCVILKK